MSEAFRTLGLTPDADARAIKRAYAARLKITHPEDDPEGFQRLRAAYERALQEHRWAEQARLEEAEAEADEETGEDEDASHKHDHDDKNTEDKPAPSPLEPAPAAPPLPHIDYPPPQSPPPGQRPAFTAPETTLDALQAAPPQDVPDAETLVENLLQLLKTRGEAAACAKLTALLQGDALLSFDAREAFQPLALEAFAEHSPLPLQLLNQLVEAFAWADHQHPLQRWGLMEKALYARNAVQARAFLQQAAAGRLTAAGSARRVAAKLLLKPGSGLWYSLEVMNIRASDAAQELIKELNSRFGAAWMEDMDTPQRKLWRVWRDESGSAVAASTNIEVSWPKLLAILVGFAGMYGLIQLLVWPIQWASAGGYPLPFLPFQQDELWPACAVAGYLFAKYALFKPFEQWGQRLQVWHRQLVQAVLTDKGRRRTSGAMLLAVLLLLPLSAFPDQQVLTLVVAPLAVLAYVLCWALLLGHVFWMPALLVLGTLYWVLLTTVFTYWGSGFAYVVGVGLACNILLLVRRLKVARAPMRAFLTTLGIGFVLMFGLMMVLSPP